MNRTMSWLKSWFTNDPAPPLKNSPQSGMISPPNFRSIAEKQKQLREISASQQARSIHKNGGTRRSTRRSTRRKTHRKRRA